MISCVCLFFFHFFVLFSFLQFIFRSRQLQLCHAIQTTPDSWHSIRQSAFFSLCFWWICSAEKRIHLKMHKNELHTHTHLRRAKKRNTNEGKWWWRNTSELKTTQMQHEPLYARFLWQCSCSSSTFVSFFASHVGQRIHFHCCKDETIERTVCRQKEVTKPNQTKPKTHKSTQIVGLVGCAHRIAFDKMKKRGQPVLSSCDNACYLYFCSPLIVNFFILFVECVFELFIEAHQPFYHRQFRIVFFIANKMKNEWNVVGVQTNWLLHYLLRLCTIWVCVCFFFEQNRRTGATTLL